MEAVILKCRPGSRFHLGLSAMRQNETLTDTAEIIHSDVLFGAFITAVAQQCPDDIEKWKTHFEKGNIHFSSAFYCVEYQGKNIYLLPKPIHLNGYKLNESNSYINAHKQLKKVRFLSKDVWEKQLLPNDWFAENSACFLPENRAVFLREEFGGTDPIFKLSEKTDTPKVKVRQQSEEGNLYTQTDLTIMGNEDAVVHWYFLWDKFGLSEEEKADAKKLIEQMAETGIGGERSTGCGHIESVCFPSDFSIKEDIAGDLFTSLSLIIPQEAETTHLLAYQVVQRGGMYYGAESSGKRIKVINALAEGAILHQPISGRIADLSTSEKKHWRNGMAFTIPLPKAYHLNNEP